MARVASFFVSLTLVWGLASGLQAHGRFPNATEIRFHPTDPDVILLQTARGLVGTRDGGATWEWLCYEVMGAETFGERDPDMVLLGDGSGLVAAGTDGITQLAPSWCDSSSSQPDTTTSYFMIDVERDPGDANAAFALTSSGGSTVNRVFGTANGGDSWAETSTDGIASLFLESLAVAPSDPQVLYVAAVTASDVSPRTASVHYSSDGGGGWTRGYSTDLSEGERRPLIAGVDPRDASRVFLWIRHDALLDNPPPDRLLLSTNGGDTFTEEHQVGSIGGFAISDDGSTVWVGDDEDGGLWRSDDGGDTFALVNDTVQVNCLEWHDGELWHCANTATDGYAVGTSSDGGESFTPVLEFSEISGMMDCPAESAGATVCETTKCDAFTELSVDLESVAPECVPDDGMPDGGMGGGSGGGCGVAGASAGAPASPALLLLALVGLAIRRRL